MTDEIPNKNEDKNDQDSDIGVASLSTPPDGVSASEDETSPEYQRPSIW